MPDATDAKVRGILNQGYLDAHPGLNDRLRRREENDPACLCGDRLSAHHGENGELHCGEDGCPCERFAEA